MQITPIKAPARPTPILLLISSLSSPPRLSASALKAYPTHSLLLPPPLRDLRASVVNPPTPPRTSDGYWTGSHPRQTPAAAARSTLPDRRVPSPRPDTPLSIPPRRFPACW